ncbi:MAG: UDP-N-acetylmuramate: L-alanyl-gamma-D-glutamyl-meso-diaminopimelate ligase [Myxococcota bacterium]|jgi:UDP-N-acetylmuramate: L-alanyl-gamma-D-glutamyl-meso-diaminopimelate ligase
MEETFEMRATPATVDWSGVERVHLMGICGSAMGAFAGMLRTLGFTVKGSDRGAYPPMSTTLAAQGVEVFEGYNAENLRWEPDVVIVGNVIRPIYDEAIALRQGAIPHCSLPQALAALFLSGKTSVVVTGTHGKTTTSSMVAWLLECGGADPSFMIGGITGNFGSNNRVADGGVFVVEGDEYDTAYFDRGPKFLHYRPYFAAINNIEYDHADIYPDVAAIEAVFERFAALVDPAGTLVVNHADPRARRVAEACLANVWTFGIAGHGGDDADVCAESLVEDASGIRWTLRLPNDERVDVEMSLAGRHNAENALVAAALARVAGCSTKDIAAGLASFRLPRKRLELRGSAAQIDVIDDFAHHPTAIRATLQAVRQRYPDRRLVALFEAQSNTARRRVFQQGFGEALSHADRVWLAKPLEKASDSLAPEARLDVSALVDAIRSTDTRCDAIGSIDALVDAVIADAQPGKDVIVAMSGRDFDGVHDRLLARLRAI